SYPTKDNTTSCRGLEPFFDDAGFLAWIDAQPAHIVVSAKHRSQATAYAAGGDKIEHAYISYERPQFGRLGRLLALRVPGAPPDAKIDRPMGYGEWNTIALAAQVSPGLLPELAKRGLSLDDGIDGVPPLVALAEWGALDAAAALIAAGADRDAKDRKGR